MLIQGDRLTISEVTQYHQQFIEIFDNNSEIILDFQNIDEIDLSGIQLLISLKKSCDFENKSLELLNIKEELLYAFSLTGADMVLGV